MPPADDHEMQLPPGKRCRDCFHFSRCQMLFGCNPFATTCDWAPSRFVDVDPRPQDDLAAMYADHGGEG